MKKCPYCAEKIQDEAIVCRYCGRDLPQTIAASTPSTPSQTPSQQPQIPAAKAKRSVWVTGAIWAAVFTALATIGEVIRYYNSPIELFGSVVGGTIASFIIWWLVCTLIIWLWRKAGNREIFKALIIIFIMFLFLTLCSVVAVLENPFPQLNSIQLLNPTETSTSKPTPNPLSNCYPWDTITLSAVGQTLCVYGRVNEIAGSVILFSRSYSQVRIIYTPVGSSLVVHKGDCIVATNLITRENGMLMMRTSQISYCPAEFRLIP